MITLLFALLLQEDPLQRALDRYERERRELEESMVELGPAGIPSLQKLADRYEAAKSAIARIEKLKPEIERLIEKLSAEKIDDREEATLALMKIGRPARAYLQAAARSKDPEVALRARTILLTFQSRPQYWAARVEIEEQAVAETRARVERGVASETQLWQAELDLLAAKRRAELLDSKTYLKARREILDTRLENCVRLNEKGILPDTEVLRAKLHVAYVDRRLGADNAAEVRALHLEIAAYWERRLKKGMMGEREYLSRFAEFILDPDEDVDR